MNKIPLQQWFNKLALLPHKNRVKNDIFNCSALALWQFHVFKEQGIESCLVGPCSADLHSTTQGITASE